MSGFGAPLGLWALLALPAIVALHLFRRRHRDQPVSALFLWQDAGNAAQAGPRRRPLRRDLNLWLELAAALLAALYLADFSPTGSGRAPRIVLVLDDSASMGARELEAGGVDVAARARAAAIERLEAAGRRARVTLVRSGERPTLLAGPDALQAEARAALAAWTPLAPQHDLEPALALARELAAGAGITLITDALPPPEAAPRGVEVVAVGAPLPNVGFLAAERASAADADEIRLAVRNFSDAPQRRRLRLLADGAEWHARELELEPQQTLRLTLPVPRGAPPVAAELLPDALAADDRALLCPPPERPVRVRVEVEADVAQALRMERLLAAVPGLRGSDADGAADLVVAHAPAPPPAWSLVLPRNAGAMEAFVGPFAAERRWPPLEGVTLDGVLWTRAVDFVLPGLPRVSVGGMPLLSEEPGEPPVLHLNLVAPRSTLQQSPDWPILWSNLGAQVRASLPGPSATTLSSGESFRYRAAAPTDLRLTGGGETRAWQGVSEIELDGLRAADDYRLSDAGGPLVAFAVNFHDAEESDLALRGSGATPAPPLAPDLAQAETPLRALWLAGCVAALAGNAWVLARRREA